MHRQNGQQPEKVPVWIKTVGLGRFHQGADYCAAVAPLEVSQNNQPFRPTTKGRMAFSTWLLLISMSSWSM